ncbi:hypothetical protein SAMN04488012_102484 [Palleronia salina]|uniref:Uncharacterized protein n=1 Tax=Palleronia salina TaxID=313368 RepID=A0A1M6DQP9_9RHOB|nr:hypothetical protein [Palleronia salina]SHI75547.1 hypothetical protein SAMN04488012_102484 [Palleronia salina]
MRRSFATGAVLAVALTLSAPLSADPSPQLARSVADRLSRYGIDVAPGALTTAQAAALHILMVDGTPYLQVRRKARTILTSPEFRD